MPNRNAILLAVGASGLALIALLLFVRSNHTTGADQAQRGRSAGTPSSGISATPLLADTSSLERPESIESSRTGEDPDPAASNPTPSPPPEPEKTQSQTSTDPGELPETTLDEMTRKLSAIRAALDEKSRPIILQRFQEGLAEHVSDEETWSGGDSEFERTSIYGLEHEAGKGWDRTVLPRWQYPDLYRLKDETIRLGKLILAAGLKNAQNN